MKELTEYLNSLPKSDRQAFAVACGTTEGYMRKAVSVGDVLNATACTAIERITGGQVTRQDLRPDDYWLIWPDLKAPKSKKAKEGVNV
jgi:DNA-binding transcriptional regulator YdaS (Cro superfamily)